MTGDEMRQARQKLGELRGLDRPLTMAEMGRLLRLGGRDPGAGIRDYERGTTRISGPLSLAIDLLLAGGTPPEGFEAAIGAGWGGVRSPRTEG